MYCHLHHKIFKVAWYKLKIKDNKVLKNGMLIKIDYDIAYWKVNFDETLCMLCEKELKGGPSDPEAKILQKY